MASKKKKTVKPISRKPQRGATTPPEVTRQPVRSLARTSDIESAKKRQRVAALLNRVNTRIGGKEGRQVVQNVDDVVDNSHVRRPCGIMQIDVDTGGGMPAQSFVTIGGPPNAGKSTLLYYYCAQHQRLYGENSYIAIASPEGGVDYLQARRCGWQIAVPKNKIVALSRDRKARGLPDFTKAEVAEMRRSVGVNTIIRGATMEEILNITERLLASNEYGLLCIDSYESLLPSAEAALDSLEDNTQQALRASIITRFFQKYGGIKAHPDHFTTFIMTTQVRTNRKKAEAPGPMQKYLPDWGDDKSAWALQHWRDVHLVVSSGAKITEGGRDDKKVIGKTVNWHIAKGKKGAHDNVRGTANYYYDKRAFEPQGTLLLEGLRYGIIREVGGAFTVYRDGKPDEYLCQIPNKELFTQALLEEPDSEWALRRDICLAAQVSHIYI